MKAWIMTPNYKDLRWFCPNFIPEEVVKRFIENELLEETAYDTEKNSLRKIDLHHGYILTNTELDAIARAAFEAGKQKGTHSYNRFDGNDIDIDDYLASDEYKKLVGE